MNVIKIFISLLLFVVFVYCKQPKQDSQSNFLIAYALTQSMKTSSIGFQEVKEFGSNPGGLKMYLFTPENLNPQAGVVFVLHGCTESASKIRNSGWEDIAKERNLLIVYPEEPSITFLDDRCFNWFNLNDITKNLGQAQSVYSMLSYVKEKFSVNLEKVFILGLSAGGYFSSVVATIYPEDFKGFASIAAGPTRCYPDGVNNISEITKCSSGYGASLETVSKTSTEWGDFIRNTKPNFSNWPRALLIHGGLDTIVKPSLFYEATKQWENLHGISSPIVTSTSSYIRSTYANKKLETWFLPNLGHAYPLNQCGKVEGYYVESDICATKVIADFFIQ